MIDTVLQRDASNRNVTESLTAVKLSDIIISGTVVLHVKKRQKESYTRSYMPLCLNLVLELWIKEWMNKEMRLRRSRHY